MMFLNCPACLDSDGAVRCGLPAEVRCRFTMRSTDGPLESVMITCPAGHSFTGPIEFLTPPSTDSKSSGQVGRGSRAGRDSGQRRDGFARRALPAEPERNVRRPNTAPAYYLGHPARLWITALGPRRERAASRVSWPSAIMRANAADMAIQLAEERNEQHRLDDDRRTSRSARSA